MVKIGVQIQYTFYCGFGKKIQMKYWEFSENCKNVFVDDMPQTSTNCPEKKSSES